LVDALDSKSSAARRAGSTPAGGTIRKMLKAVGPHMFAPRRNVAALPQQACTKSPRH
jgi:hypothetical protein